jgi:hypothetical protein
MVAAVHTIAFLRDPINVLLTTILTAQTILVTRLAVRLPSAPVLN